MLPLRIWPLLSLALALFVQGCGPSVTIEREVHRGPATEAQLAALEAELGTTLPEDYRHFLATQASFPTDRKIYLPAFDTNENVTYFYWPTGDEDDQYELIADRVYTPEGYLQFAADGYGNFFCIGLTPPQRGRILCVDFDFFEGDPDVGVRIDNPGVQPVAESFGQFLEILDVPPPGSDRARINGA